MDEDVIDLPDVDDEPEKHDESHPGDLALTDEEVEAGLADYLGHDDTVDEIDGEPA